MKMPVFGKALLLGGGWIWIEEDRESEGILALALVPCFYVDIYSRRTYWFIFCSINIYWAFFMCQCLGCSNKMVNSTKRISLIFKFFFLFFLRKMFFFSHSWVGFLTCILSGNIKHEQKMVSKSSLPAPSPKYAKNLLYIMGVFKKTLVLFGLNIQNDALENHSLSSSSSYGLSCPSWGTGSEMNLDWL